MEDEEDEALSRIVSELEALHDDDQIPFSDAALLDLQSLADCGGADRLWDHLASRNLPPSSLVRPISAAMDSATPRPSLLASAAYLSLLLSPSSPVYTLFTPLAFLSLLRALRRSLKPRHPASSDSPPPSSDPQDPPRAKKGRKRKDARPPRDDGPSADHHRCEDAGDLLLRVLKLLESVLGRICLDGSQDALKSLVDTVARILDSTSGRHHLSDLCFRILHVVISRPEHGNQGVSSVEVLRSLAPAFLSPAKSLARTSALGFVTRRMVPLGRENDGVRNALIYLPRFLAMKAPEKSEPRACAVDGILEIVRAIGQEDQVGFADFAVKMTQGEAKLRLLAVDLILGLLTSLPDPLGVKDSDEEIMNHWGIKCFKSLQQRCSDSVGGIRARALTNLAQVVGYFSGDAMNIARLRDAGAFGNTSFSELLRRRCVDEKAAVRKAALLLITRSTALIGRPIDEVVLRTMGSACSDPLVSIRKAALAALSEVFRRFPDASVVKEWLHAVPPLIVDNETSIQEECECLFLELVLDRISQVAKLISSNEATDLESVFPEGVLTLMKGICDGEVAPCVRKICTSLGKKKKIKDSIARSLQNIITTSESLWLRGSVPIEKWTAPPGAWQLLSEVSLFTSKAVDWKFLHHHWQLLDKAKTDLEEEKCEVFDGLEHNSMSWAGDRVSLLVTISNVSMELPPEPAADLAHNLLKRIEDFNMHLSEVDAHVKALRTLCKRKATNPEEGNALILKWVHQLLSKALKILDKTVSEVSETGKVNSFLSPQNRRRKGKASKSIVQAVTAVFTIGSLILVCPSADLQGIIPLLQTIITSGNTETKPTKPAGLTISIREMAPSMYIQSWVTMGKICLVDAKLAKCYIPLFVQELEKSDYAAVRNNIMVMMADFCVRYTALVDCYIPKITSSLRDPCEVVRRQTFILLSRLLQRDYVKWRGVLFLRFLLSLVDESDKIRHLADFLFGSILKVKAPLLAYNSFIEAIYVLNDCRTHAGHSETQGGPHNRPFSIRGNNENSRSKRMHIYVSLLKQMAPEHLLATSAKICAEVLAAASDGLLNVDDATGQSVLQDALQILACKEMRIHPSRSTDAAEMDDEGAADGGGSGGAILAARGRVVTQVAKKNLIQIAIPIFIELKRLLESKNSPITGSLMECLRVLLKDYKNEIDEILVADKQLQKELIYDMEKYEAAKAKSRVAEAVATAQRSGSYSSPTNRLATGVYVGVSEKLGTGGKIASAIADAAARATARSVLKEVNQNVATPPLHSMSVPKMKSAAGNGGALRGDRASEVLESLRRRQSFESDDES